MVTMMNHIELSLPVTLDHVKSNLLKLTDETARYWFSCSIHCGRRNFAIINGRIEPKLKRALKLLARSGIFGHLVDRKNLVDSPEPVKYLLNKLLPSENKTTILNDCWYNVITGKFVTPGFKSDLEVQSYNFYVTLDVDRLHFVFYKYYKISDGRLYQVHARINVTFKTLFKIELTRQLRVRGQIHLFGFLHDVYSTIDIHGIGHDARNQSAQSLS